MWQQRSLTVVAFVTLFTVPLAANAFTPVVSSERPLASTPSFGTRPEIVGYPDGSFLALWQAYGPPIFDIVARRFDASGAPAGTEFLIAQPDSYTAPSASARPDGGFVAIWTVGNDSFVRGRIFDGSDLPITPELEVSDVMSATQAVGAVAVRSDGRFLVAWGRRTAPQETDVYARVFDSAGAPLGTEFLVNAYTTEIQTFPKVAATTAGNFAIVWGDREQDGTFFSVFGRLIDGDGNALTSEFAVNTYTTELQLPGNVAATNAGGFVVVWHSLGQDGDEYGGFGRRFDSSGAPLGTEFQVNSYTTENQSDPNVSVRGDDAFLVTWNQYPYGGNARIHAQLFDATAQPIGDSFQVNGFAADSSFGARPFLPDSGNEFHAVLERASTLNAGGHEHAVYGTTGCLGADTDTDGDGVGDSCDACVKPPGRSFEAHALSRFRGINATIPDDRFNLSGEFEVPLPLFSDIDPIATPLRIRVEADRRHPVVDVELTTTAYAGNGTAGWSTNAAGTKWTYRDKSGDPRQGIVLVKLAQRANGNVKMKLTGKAGPYGLSAEETKLQTTVVFGDPASGECAETEFLAADCAYDALGSTFTCRD